MSRRITLPSSALLALSLAGLLACGCAAGSDDDVGSGGGGAGKADIPFKGVSITDVDLFQTVEVPLFDQGQITNTGRPVVAGKQSLLRISYAVDAGFAPRNAEVRVSFESASAPAAPISLTQQIIATSTPDVLDSALIVPIDGTSIATDTAIRVELFEIDPNATGEAGPGPTTFPAQGFHPLNAQSIGNPTKIVVVPIAYQPDGSGRLPDTSESQLEALRKRFVALYPTPSVDLTLGASWSYDGPPVQRDGDGWTDLLGAFSDAHHGPGSSITTYYLGFFQPDTSFSAYCQGGCTTGLSYVSEQPSNADARSSVALGFPGETAVETAMHELGHAHGFNGHAPCGGAGSINPNFPHSDGMIGVYGLDVAELAYKSPQVFSDVMSYCDDNWTSDFTWALWFERTRIVGQVNADWHGPREPWQSLVLRADGTVVPLSTRERRPPSGSERRPVRVLGPRGELLGVRDAVFLGTDHLAGGMLWIREVPGAARFEIAAP